MKIVIIGLIFSFNVNETVKEAKELRLMGKYEQSLVIYKKVLPFLKGKEKVRVMLDILYLYYNLDNPTEGLEFCVEIEKMLSPYSFFYAEYLYKKALLYEKLGIYLKAQEIYETIVLNHRDSEYAKKAEKRMEELFEILKNEYIAKVGPLNITWGEYEKYAERLPIKPSPSDTSAIKRVLKNLIRWKIMYLLALENKMDTDPEFLEEIKRAREGILARMYTKFLEKNVVITEKDKRRYYVKNKEEFKIPYMWDFRRIEVKTKEECEEILEKLKKGEDFSELAKKFSVAPEGKRGGLIRHFTEKSIPEEFVPVLKTMRVGEIRGPIKLKTGNYAIIKLEKKTPGRYRGYEEVEKHIEGMLRKEKTREMWEKWEKEVFKRFEVKYFIEK